jgi:hypothetical protein
MNEAKFYATFNNIALLRKLGIDKQVLSSSFNLRNLMKKGVLVTIAK